MTIKEAVESLRKEKVCRTLDATTCLLTCLSNRSSCDKCEYNIDESELTEALCVVVSYFDEIDI